MSYKECPCCKSKLTVNQFFKDTDLCVYCTVKQEAKKKEEQGLDNNISK